jgi:hypothetical protein
MSRLIGLLAVTLGLLCLLDQTLDRRARRQRQQLGAIVSLAPHDLDPRIVDVRAANGSWRYVYEAGAWRFPAYHAAFVVPERMDALLRSIRGSAGTRLNVSAEELPALGLAAGQRLELSLSDIQGRPLTMLYVGNPVPGTGGREAFVQIAGQSAVFHGHTNPRLTLGQPPQALIDARVLPAALGIASVREIHLEGPAAPDPVRLERVRESGASPLTGGPAYRWWLHRQDQRLECVGTSVGAYVSYLRQLRFQALHDPRKFVPAQAPGRIVLYDELGRIDTLDVGAAAASSVWLRLRSTGQVTTIDGALAELLFPADAALLQELPEPTPYQQARQQPLAPSR